MDPILDEIISSTAYRSTVNKSYDDGIHNSNNSSIIIGSDSGYGSHYNISDVSSNITTYRTSLEPITEDNEEKSFINSTDVTPTTRNIQRIDAFHITSPKCLTPSKRMNVDHRSALSDCTPEKLRKIEHTSNETPKKSESTQKYNRQRLAFDKFNSCTSFGSDDYDIADIENDSFVEKIPFSPLMNHQTNLNHSILENHHRQFERKLSENSIQSSTPKNFELITKLNTKTIAKTKFSSKLDASLLKTNKFRKTQSFSPSKYFKTSIDYSLKNKLDNIVSVLPNPAKKLLDFSPNIFEKIVQERDAQQKQQKTTQPLETTITSIKNVSTQPENNAECINFSFLNQSSFIIDDCIRKNDTQNDEIKGAQTNLDNHSLIFDKNELSLNLTSSNKTETNTQLMQKLSDNSNETIITESLSVNNFETTQKSLGDIEQSANKSSMFECDESLTTNIIKSTDDIIPSKVDSSIFSNKLDLQLNTTKVLDSSINLHDIQCTPTKKLRRSTSLHQYNPAIEKNKILYNHLPCTPPKNHRRKSLKRQLAIQIPESPAKRQLYANDSIKSNRKKSLVGLRKVDIFYKLSETTPAIELIFNYLTDKDLTNMCMVSKNWHFIITNHRKANNRRNKYLRHLAEIKENLDDNKCVQRKITIGRKCKPLSRNNTFPLIQKKTPTPKKPLLDIKNILQDVINPHLVKCPKCNSPSLVKTDTPQKILETNYDTAMIPFQKARSVSIDDTINCDKIRHSAKHFQKNIKLTNDYATCTTEKCNFQFCVNCNCAYNCNGHACLMKPIGSHGLKEKGEENSGVSVTRNSKRSLRRLFSIDKIK